MSEPKVNYFDLNNLKYDIPAGLVTALVALPLCLGIASASGAPAFSGLLAGIIGGIVVGVLSGSHTSVTGPAAAMIAIVVAQIARLGSFETFLLAVLISGIIQVALGVFQAGELSAFFPSSVVKGLLAAIGIILILKQTPHLFGRIGIKATGAMDVQQLGPSNILSGLFEIMTGNLHLGAMTIGIICLLLLLIWDRIEFLKQIAVPGALVVTVLGVLMAISFKSLGNRWSIEPTHLVSIEAPTGDSNWLSLLSLPDFSQLTNPAVYVAALTIAIISSLATLLNLEAIDKLDPLKRQSPPSRELVAQGIGNSLAGLCGGLPMTAVVIRGSVNITAGARTKASAVIHGVLVLVSVVFFTRYLNMIPLSTLAAILVVTGFKLASPALFKQMWTQGKYQFIPFVATVSAIVLTDVLTGILIGLAIGLVFVLHSNAKQPIRVVSEEHLDGPVTHLLLANQVSYLKRAAMSKVLNSAAPGSNILVDASDTNFIDPDVLALIREYKDQIAPQRDITVSLRGFREKYELDDEIQFVDYSSRELLDRMTPEQAIDILVDGNVRFRTGKRLRRDLIRQVAATSEGQHPFAAVLSCIDSRVPAELVFDLGIGEMFSVRVAGNVIGDNLLGSLEFAVVLSKVKVIVVLGHKHCGAINSSLKLLSENANVADATGCPHLPVIVEQIKTTVSEEESRFLARMSASERELFADEIAIRNILRAVEQIKQQSKPIREAVTRGQLMVVGAIYDVDNGKVDFLCDANDNTQSRQIKNEE